MSNELGDPEEALNPGGIDFGSLQLRYLSLSGHHQDDLQYSMDGGRRAGHDQPEHRAADGARGFGRVLHLADAASEHVLGEPIA
ncbi:MAG TPA: hypothetical protein VGI55_05310 [Solirubrobacteraceae bacterium]